MDTTRPTARAVIVTVADVFHAHRFVIPDYQREFSWGETTIRVFADDLITAFLGDDVGEERASPEYFLGAFVTQPILAVPSEAKAPDSEDTDDGEDGETPNPATEPTPSTLPDDWSANPAERGPDSRTIADRVIDGQQRITCLMILLAWLAARCRRAGEGEPARQTAAHLDALVIRSDTPGGLILEARDYAEAFAVIAKDTAPVLRDVPRQAGAGQVLRAYGIIRARLDRALSEPSEAARFAQWLATRTYFAHIADTNPYDDQRLFDRINTRGESLAGPDKFRSHIIAHHPRRPFAGRRDTARRWRQARAGALSAVSAGAGPGAAGAASEADAETQLLIAWAIGRELFADGAAMRVAFAREIERDPYEWLTQVRGTRHAGDRENLVRALRNGFFAYVSQAERHWAAGARFDDELAGFRTAAIAQTPYANALAAAVVTGRRDADGDLRAVARFLDVISAQRAWDPGVRPLATLRETMLEAILVARDARGPALVGALQELASPPKPAFAPGRDVRLTAANRRWIRYLLSRLALHANRAYGGPAKPHPVTATGRDTPEIEQLLAHPTPDQDAAFGGQAGTASAQARLGALTLVRRETHARGRGRAYRAKRELYREENLLARSLVEPVALPGELEARGAPAFVSVEEITPQAIEARHQLYAALAADLWRLEAITAD